MRGRERGDQAFPCVRAVGMGGEHLAVDGVGLIGVAAQKIDGGQLQLQSDAGLAAGGDLQLDGALEQALRNLKLLACW